MKIKESIMVQEWLKDLPIDEVNVLAKMSDQKEAQIFYKFLKSEAERRKNIIWALPEYDPTHLAIEKAAHRGAIEAIHTIISMIVGSQAELDRRSEGVRKTSKK